MKTTWKDLDAGMFFLLRSTTRPRPFGFKPLFKNYVQNHAMCTLVQVVNVHKSNGVVSQMYLKVLGLRDICCPAHIEAKHANDLYTVHVKDPDDFFKSSKIQILK